MRSENISTKEEKIKLSSQIDMKRILNLDLTVGIGEGSMLVDGREIYNAKGLKVGLFQDTSSF